MGTGTFSRYSVGTSEFGMTVKKAQSWIYGLVLDKWYDVDTVIDLAFEERPAVAR